MKSNGVLREYSSVLNAALHVVDWAVIVASGWLIHRLYLGTFTLTPQHYQLLIIVLLLTALIFPMFRLYEAWRGVSIVDEAYAISLAWGTVLLVVMVLAFVTKNGANYSRGWLAGWALTGWFVLIVTRTLLRTTLSQMRRRGFNRKRVVITGTVELGTEVARQIRATPWMGLEVVAYFHANGGPQDACIPDVPHVGCLDTIADYVAENDIEQVWIALPLGSERKLRHLLHLLRNSTVDIRFVPDLYGLRLLNHSVTEIAGLPVVNMSVTPMAGINVLVKFLEDRILASLILLIISPLMLMIAVGVKLSSPGPVIFKQMRYGWDGKPIEIYKFRTMKPHTEADGEITQAKNGDNRITRFGALLRHSSLDELPQFINVLQGRMSIVGPRPHAVAHNEQYKDLVDGYMKRHKVKPGITGWAQVNGWRGETNTLEKMQKRVEYDLHYIEHWSLLLDIKIIVQTVLTGFANRNAY